MSICRFSLCSLRKSCTRYPCSLFYIVRISHIGSLLFQFFRSQSSHWDTTYLQSYRYRVSWSRIHLLGPGRHLEVVGCRRCRLLAVDRKKSLIYKSLFLSRRTGSGHTRLLGSSRVLLS